MYAMKKPILQKDVIIIDAEEYIIHFSAGAFSQPEN